MLDPRRTQRYRRHDLIDWFSQEQVSAARVAVIGAGAVGNEVIKNLALLGCGTIDVFDFDVVELHNLTRGVLLRESDAGRNKAEAVNQYRRRNQGLRLANGTVGVASRAVSWGRDQNGS